MFKKITYNGTECNNYLYFSFYSEYFDTDIISDELKIKSTQVYIKNNPIPKSTSWEFKIEVGNEIDLEKPLEKLIEIFDSKIEEINRLKERLNLKTRLQFVIDVDINPESSTPYFPLNNKAIEFLSKTKTEVDFDIYKVDTIGLLKEEN